MTERKWTPGPWFAALERGCHGVVAQTLPEGGANFVAIVGNDADTPDKEPTRFANARLIAAAPDLYEALEAVFDECEYSMSSMVFALCEAALAKARGENDKD